MGKIYRNYPLTTTLGDGFASCENIVSLSQTSSLPPWFIVTTVSSISKFSETQLPPKSEFYSKLNDEDISEEDYQHAQNVWKTFNSKTIKDYHDLCLKSDVLFLVDVFENFRKTSLKHCKLDPCHYYSAPSLAWDACLKETKQHSQLLHHYDMLMMFEKGIRGGISHISKRYSEANNKYMENYDSSKPSKFITYLDGYSL